MESNSIKTGGSERYMENIYRDLFENQEAKNTFKMGKNTFDCEHRGEIEVKNKGMMKPFPKN